MRTLKVFNNVSLDGFIADSHRDMSWAHNDDPEWIEFMKGNASNSDATELIFGRKTFEMLASYWPTPMAAQNMPEVAAYMNRARKTVFSRTIKEAAWNNTHIANGNPEETVAQLKKEKGGSLLIFGSGEIVAQLAQKNLIDEYQLIVHPVVLGGGLTMFKNAKLNLKLVSTRAFKNGNVVLTYQSL